MKARTLLLYIIVVKPLVWRSERVTRFLQQLDEKCKDTKTTQAKRQRKQRVASNDASVRPKPVVANLPSWAFCWATHDQCDDCNMLLHHSVILLIILFPVMLLMNLFPVGMRNCITSDCSTLWFTNFILQKSYIGNTMNLVAEMVHETCVACDLSTKCTACRIV